MCERDREQKRQALEPSAFLRASPSEAATLLVSGPRGTLFLVSEARAGPRSSAATCRCSNATCPFPPPLHPCRALLHEASRAHLFGYAILDRVSRFHPQKYLTGAMGCARRTELAGGRDVVRQHATWPGRSKACGGRDVVPKAVESGAHHYRGTLLIKCVCEQHVATLQASPARRTLGVCAP